MAPLESSQSLRQSLRGTMQFSSLVPLAGLVPSRDAGMGIRSPGSAGLGCPCERSRNTRAAWDLGLINPTTYGRVSSHN